MGLREMHFVDNSTAAEFHDAIRSTECLCKESQPQTRRPADSERTTLPSPTAVRDPASFFEDVKRLLQQSSLGETAQEESRPFRNSDTRGRYRRLPGCAALQSIPPFRAKETLRRTTARSSPQPGIASWVCQAPLPVARHHSDTSKLNIRVRSRCPAAAQDICRWHQQPVAPGNPW